MSNMKQTTSGLLELLTNCYGNNRVTVSNPGKLSGRVDILASP